MADKVIINPSGKRQLMASGVSISAHRELCANKQMQPSLNLGLLEYQRQLAANTGESGAAAANMFKLKGAQEFIDIFLKLAEETQVLKADPRPEQNLIHTL